MGEDTGGDIVTGRLILRRWRPEDRAPFAVLNADPRVCEFLPAPLSKAESDSLADRIEEHFEQHGFGRFAVEERGTNAFIGFAGLSHPSFDAPFMPAVEISWRLDARHWGQGYATEAARAALAHGFSKLHLEEVVSFTVPANARSRRIMEKIGMYHDAQGDFQHPMLPHGHPLRFHVLYRTHPAPIVEEPAEPDFHTLL